MKVLKDCCWGGDAHKDTMGTTRYSRDVPSRPTTLILDHALLSQPCISIWYFWFNINLDQYLVAGSYLFFGLTSIGSDIDANMIWEKQCKFHYNTTYACLGMILDGPTFLIWFLLITTNTSFKASTILVWSVISELLLSLWNTCLSRFL